MSFNESQEIQLIGKIPVRNLWLLLLYASKLFRESGNRFVKVEENPDDIPNLVAEILCYQVNQRIHRNLSYGYISKRETLDRVRGSIDLLKTETEQLLDRGKIACRFDELSIDTPRNRYVRDALTVISKVVSDKELRHKCQFLAKRFQGLGVVGPRPSKNVISNERFGRNDKHDRPMVEAAHLAFNLVLPTESTGTKFLPIPSRKIEWIRKLFEKGIAGFYDVKLSNKGWSVYSGKKYDWPLEYFISDSLENNVDFPSMKTDIVLDDHINFHRIVIDTKFNSLLTSGWYKDESLRSSYIYQIYAYLRSQEGMEGLDGKLSENATGMLLHPSIDSQFTGTVLIQNHKIRFATVDLSKPAIEISERLMQVTEFELKNVN